ncbi:hypothetical protein K505DRAFT_368829, partial [Melanomma pulvis-pyrius CBS 109.77]
MADYAPDTSRKPGFIEIFPGIPPPKAEIKERIFKHAGREAIAAYQVASGNSDENQEPYVQIQLLYEPFTYWDWHNLIEGEYSGMVGYTDPRKRSLLWERERSYKSNGNWNVNPAPWKRWSDFTLSINDNNRHFVKRIALPHQLGRDELQWVARNLPELDALDLSAMRDDQDTEQDGRFFHEQDAWDMYLSDMQYVGTRMLELEDLDHFTWLSHDPPRKAEVARMLTSLNEERQRAYAHRTSRSTSNNPRRMLAHVVEEYRKLCSSIIENQDMYDRGQQKQQAHNLNDLNSSVFTNLKWLGIRDWRKAKTQQNIIDVVLPQCKNLTTLSIRGEYIPDPEVDPKRTVLESRNAHLHICDFVLRIAKFVPDTVKTIELRMALPVPKHFLLTLHKLKPTIERVGIDLGAWVQIYPIRKGSVDEFRVSRRDVWREEGRMQQSTPKPHYYRDNSGSDSSTKHPVYVSTSSIGCPLDRQQQHETTVALLYDNKTTTLPQMFKKLYDCRHRDEGGDSSMDIRLFPLEPEPWSRSSNPVHPLALLQTTDKAQGGIRENYEHFDPDKDMAVVYKWLEQVFQWRPVFDWDWFMVPERMRESVDPAYKQLLLGGKERFLSRIRTHFDYLRDAGIPVHLLIGRRDDKESSSCYWGWPYEEKRWSEWLDTEFDSNLDQIASAVDSLSIFYDLRNPLDKERLEEIDALSPHIGPNAKCPSAMCPWGKGDGGHDTQSVDCPFYAHREPQGHSNRKSPIKQKMANKQALKPKKKHDPNDYSRLANSSTATPPVGENAADHPSDDSDSSDTSPPIEQANLHRLARRAAYARETVGWQRFWSKYSLRFTRLSLLRVRMPRSFDKVGSWRLARLLDQRLGWKMCFFTDERQHVQTVEDVVETLEGYDREIFEHHPEVKVWPAGRFVRRSWFWPERELRFRAVAQDLPKEQKSDHVPGDSKPITKWEAVVQKSSMWANRTFNDKDFSEYEAKEQQECQKAIKRAEVAALRERKFEERPEFAKTRKQFAQARKSSQQNRRTHVQEVSHQRPNTQTSDLSIAKTERNQENQRAGDILQSTVGSQEVRHRQHTEIIQDDARVIALTGEQRFIRQSMSQPTSPAPRKESGKSEGDGRGVTTESDSAVKDQAKEKDGDVTTVEESPPLEPEPELEPKLPWAARHTPSSTKSTKNTPVAKENEVHTVPEPETQSASSSQPPKAMGKRKAAPEPEVPEKQGQEEPPTKKAKTATSPVTKSSGITPKEPEPEPEPAHEPELEIEAQVPAGDEEKKEFTPATSAEKEPDSEPTPPAPVIQPEQEEEGDDQRAPTPPPKKQPTEKPKQAAPIPAPSPPPKKKPGRKARHPVPTAPAEESPDDDDHASPPPAKKPPGRPAKRKPIAPLALEPAPKRAKRR